MVESRTSVSTGAKGAINDGRADAYHTGSGRFTKHTGISGGVHLRATDGGDATCAVGTSPGGGVSALAPPRWLQAHRKRTESGGFGAGVGGPLHAAADGRLSRNGTLNNNGKRSKKQSQEYADKNNRQKHMSRAKQSLDTTAWAHKPVTSTPSLNTIARTVAHTRRPSTATVVLSRRRDFTAILPKALI